MGHRAVSIAINGKPSESVDDVSLRGVLFPSKGLPVHSALAEPAGPDGDIDRIKRGVAQCGTGTPDIGDVSPTELVKLAVRLTHGGQCFGWDLLFPLKSHPEEFPSFVTGVGERSIEQLMVFLDVGKYLRDACRFTPAKDWARLVFPNDENILPFDALAGAVVRDRD